MTLRVLGACLAAAGDRPAARFALRQAVALSGATEMRAELTASQKALDSLEVLDQSQRAKRGRLSPLGPYVACLQVVGLSVIARSVSDTDGMWPLRHARARP